MNKSDLNQSLGFINQPVGELQIIIYANLDNEEEPRKLDIKGDDLPELKQIFVEGINFYILDKEDYSVLQLSDADERGKCFYQYDLEVPEELKVLENVIGNDNLQNFDFNINNLASIESVIVVLADDENEISLFKTISPVEVIGRGGYIFKRANQRFERFEDQLLRMTAKFQVIRVAEEIIITNLNSIEKSLGFHDVITREATLSLDVINQMSLVKNIESLQELVTDVSFARKLTKVAKNSPVIKHNIPNSSIIDFSKIHPLTKKKMRYSEDGTQFNLDTRVSKDLLIKILNDDLLTSELTKLYYDSLAKDGVEIEQDQEQEENHEIDS
ncbi:MAG: anti-phage protein KwaB [Brumimicrobium sp.]